jgi:hypothetical protein
MINKLIVLSSFILLQISQSTAQRKVLIEQFTNSGCPPCAATTPGIALYVNANLNSVLMLSYHTYFPYSDSMYYENSFQSDNRSSFYHVTSVPYSIVDGNYFNGNSAPLLPVLSQNINARLQAVPRYNISFLSSVVIGNSITSRAIFESSDNSNSPDSLVAHIVVVEKNVLKISYLAPPGNNSETEYPWVVRRMLPDQNGTMLINKSIHGRDTISVSTQLSNIKNLNEVRLIAFVQNVTTHEVYQSELSSPMLLNAVGETKAINMLFIPASTSSGDIKITLKDQGEAYLLSVHDLTGKTIYTKWIQGSKYEFIPASDWNKGIYLITLMNDKKAQTKRWVVE